VWISLEAAKRLAQQGKAVRVVSMPCWEAFALQDPSYRESVLPNSVQRRMSVEAGTPMGWERWARFNHGVRTFGLSGPWQLLAQEFGFTVEAVLAHYLDLN
jgi:transketolase